ncbi:MAG: hypothetical protein WCG55_01365 [bacterium]
MKKILLIAVLGLSQLAQAQVSVSFTATNGQMSAKVATRHTGLIPGHQVVRSVMVSNTIDFSTIVGAVVDSFVATDTIMFSVDSVHTSVPYPNIYWVKDSVWQADTVATSAVATNDSGVLLTPFFRNPTKVLSAPTVDSSNAYFHGTFTSGYDIAIVRVVVSYGDSLFLSPEFLFPAVSDTIHPVLGTTVQNVVDSIVIPIGVNNLPFSYRVYTINSKKADTSIVYHGRTKYVAPAGINGITPQEIIPGTITIYSLAGVLLYSAHEENLSVGDRLIKQEVTLPTGNYVQCSRTDSGLQLPGKIICW